MPILYFLKNPPVSLATLGKLTPGTVKAMSKQIPLIVTQAPDGKTMLIASETTSNIAYIKEVTEEALEKMKEERSEAKRGPRIHPQFAVPSGKKGRG